MRLCLSARKICCIFSLSMATRKSDLVFLILYELPGPYYLTINGFKLPTNLQVLSFFCKAQSLTQGWRVKQEQLRTDVAAIVTNQSFIMRGKADIPVLSDSSIQGKLYYLHDQYLSVKKWDPNVISLSATSTLR